MKKDRKGGTRQKLLSEVIKSFFFARPRKKAAENKRKSEKQKINWIGEKCWFSLAEKFMNSLNSFRSVQVKSLGIYDGGRIKVSDV